MIDKEVQLRVGEIPSNAQADIGIGIVRFDTKILRELNIREGDPVSIEGKKLTGAIAVRAYPSDVGLSNIIRMDGYTRRNAGTGIGEQVTVKPLVLKEAKKITIAPAEHNIPQVPIEHIKRLFMGRIVIKGDIIVPINRIRRTKSQLGDFIGIDVDEMLGGFGFGELRFVVVSSDFPGISKITDLTDIKVLSTPVDLPEEQGGIGAVTYEDVGGLKEVVTKVREMIELPLKHPELFTKLGIDPPKGVLLYGPPGTGKTLLARAVAAETGASFYSIAGPEVMSKFYGESEENVRKIFKEAEDNAPSIIFIDEIDALAPKREKSGEVERRVVAQLLSLMDGLKGRGQVVVIAATNLINSIDPALRRGGRFDREIEVGVPTRDGRLEVLQIHTRNMPLSKRDTLKGVSEDKLKEVSEDKQKSVSNNAVDLEKIADETYGYVGADLNALCKEAAMSSLRRNLPNINLKDDMIDPKIIEKITVIKKDFQNALRFVEPSAMREIMVEIPRVKWDDVGGLKDAKQSLIEMIEWPLKTPEVFKNMGIKPPRGILLYGLPGTGKTLLARAVASKSKSNFISIKGPEIFDKYVGESEKAIRDLFKRAKQVAPSIIFIDEIDSIAPKRGHGMDSGVADRVVNQLLTEMDGLESLEGVVVVAATNRPELLDMGLLRPGRFDRHLYVPVPDTDARKSIFNIYLKKMPLTKDVDINKLVELSENYVGADIEAICREAAINALRSSNLKAKEIKMVDFEKAFERVKATATAKDIENYDKKVKASKISKEDDLSYFG
ncbi:MAG: CDC48 family AAA ATPase [DPANN group archaeon]|nr:CDC48 family AAA ATPase [DPANN group archaeon]